MLESSEEQEHGHVSIEEILQLEGLTKPQVDRTGIMYRWLCRLNRHCEPCTLCLVSLLNPAQNDDHTILHIPLTGSLLRIMTVEI